ncbi:MAG: thioredoxin domain-containing protein [Thermoplasmatota archaeon]
MSRQHKREPNRLIDEPSPYLQQHAYNPVDWYPWSEEAFQHAREQDKPIFLSIGYSTCHWCHVMAEESFEDEEVAALLNDTFICIKVDREERPDIDSIYMTAAQLITGTGGWPLTIFMTPDRQPFYAATYLPKHARFGQPGLMELVQRVRELWTTGREELLATAGRLTHALQNMPQPTDELPNRDTLDEGYRQLHASFDATHGGFNGAPKFPTPHRLLFLLRYWCRTREPEALGIVEATLQAMHDGGMYDHLGGGFHRYATDARWRVPHFEKMLYDQALLVLAYLEVYQATARKQYAKVARETLAYVLRDLQHPQGGFSAAEDADSPEGEGAFYRWTRQDIEDILGSQAELFFQAYDVSDEGTLYRIASDEQLGEQLLEARQRLYRARSERTRPAQDDKILADWNGLMIAALARAGQVFDDERYIETAERAAGFIWQHMHDNGGIRHRYRDGHVSQQRYASDAAFYIWGLIELYLATFTPAYLKQAIQIQDDMFERFWNTARGGFYLTEHDSDTPLVRSMPTEDGALPSANAIAMYNLLRLGHLTGEQRWHDLAEQLLTLAASARRWPTAHTMWLSALELAYGTSRELVVTAPEEQDAISAIRGIQRQYLPHTVILFKREGITKVAPFTRDMPAGDAVTFYVCTGQTCRAPTTDISVVLDELDPPQRHDLAEP